MSDKVNANKAGSALASWLCFTMTVLMFAFIVAFFWHLACSALALEPFSFWRLFAALIGVVFSGAFGVLFHEVEKNLKAKAGDDD